MCGLFGFDGGAPNREILRQIAKGAATRGPHAYGFAWHSVNLGYHKEAGHLEDHLDKLSLMHYAHAGIGQARLATSGEWWDNANNQPLRTTETAIVHNGNVYNWREIYAEYGYTCKTNSDSEAILLLAENAEWGGEAQLITGRVDRRSPMAVLVLDAKGVAAFRTGHPLYVMSHEDVTYWCSRNVYPDMVLLRETV